LSESFIAGTLQTSTRGLFISRIAIFVSQIAIRVKRTKKRPFGTAARGGGVPVRSLVRVAFALGKGRQRRDRDGPGPQGGGQLFEKLILLGDEVEHALAACMRRTGNSPTGQHLIPPNGTALDGTLLTINPQGAIYVTE
jgi:hypothetical protein